MFAICAKRIVRVLIIAVLFFALAGLLSRGAMYVWGAEGYLSPLRLFDVGAENNIPTWFSSFELLLCSVLLAVIALAKKQGGDRYGRHWGVLSAICLLLSIDEEASIHEAMGAELERLLGNTTGWEAEGFISFFWVVPAAAFVLVVALAYRRFFAHLPRSTRRLFVVAGTLFLLGALGMEMVEAQVVSVSGGEANWGSVSGPSKIVVGLLTDVEDLFEMLGITVFVYALLVFIASHVGDINVRVLIDKHS